MPLAGQRIQALDFTPAVKAEDLTLQVNVSTTMGVGSPEVGVVFTAPTSGKVTVTVSASMVDDSGANNVGILDWKLFLGTNGSGTLILNTGSVLRRLILQPGDVGGQSQEASRTTMVTSLTPGASYYVQLHQASSAGGTIDFYGRSVTVVPLPA
jgi:hypothetical protein